MAKEEKDDLEAVRILIDALTPFDTQERERIIRWACEKLGVTNPTFVNHLPATGNKYQSIGETSVISSINTNIKEPNKDIKSFINEKNPQSDQQLAAVIAYYYAFEAPENDRKNSIGSEEIINACRHSQRRRPKKPIQTLINAAFSGFLDKAEETGMYRLNAVGENLVAMTLPSGVQSKISGHSKAKKTVKKPTKKKTK
jgi:hypothetical protein